jgi:hypothetical protein
MNFLGYFLMGEYGFCKVSITGQFSNRKMSLVKSREGTYLCQP